MNLPAISIQPVPHPLSASLRVPGSKSLTNRALMVAALSDGKTVLTNALFSDDSLYFVESLRRLGFDVQLESPAQEGDSQPASELPGVSSGGQPHGVAPTGIPSMTVTGMKGRIPAGHAELYTGNAGTAARFLMGLLVLGHGDYILDGDDRMRQRPVQDLINALQQLGANIDGFRLPVNIRAQGLRGGCAVVGGDVSSQFLSGLLLAVPYAQNLVEVRVERGLNSKPFVDMTLAVMADFGVSVARDGYDRFVISPQGYHSPGIYPIECDATAASYFFAAPAICGGTVKVEGITRRSKQGDIAFLDVLVQMGCTVTDELDGVSVTGPQTDSDQPASRTRSTLRGVALDMRDIPDIAQTLAVVAPFACTPTTIRGIASARHKETDRVAAICAELTRLGVRVEEYPDGLTIYPCQNIQPAAVQTYQDHRMAMAFSLIGLRVPGITILDPGCVSKTFPDYFRVLSRLQL
jgi:3-phosphoshikimate 1-carboxyvinyltransferase